MPSRVFPPETREDEASTTSTSASYQSASPGLESAESPLEERLPDQPGTKHRKSQSLAEGAAHSSSTAAHHHRCEASTSPETSPNELKPQNHRRPASSPSSLQALAGPRTPSTASYFARQPGASAPDARSPFARRAPASRSSHGIETLSGPPPALITQRSYTVDSPWKYTPPVDLEQPSPQANSKTTATTEEDIRGSTEKDRVGDSLSRDSERPDSSMGPSKRVRNSYSLGDDNDEKTLRGTEISLPHRSEDRNRTGNEHLEKQSESSHEDLFLNLARADSAAGGDSANQKQRRRSRISLSSTQPPVSYRPSSSRQSDYGSRETLRQSPSSIREHDAPNWEAAYASHRDSPGSKDNGKLKDRQYAASAHPLDQRLRASYPRPAPRASVNASRVHRPSTRETSPEVPVPNSGRRFSVEPLYDPPTSTIRQSGHLYAAPDQYNSSPLNGYSFLGQRQIARRSSRVNGTESTLSTNAPSMILEQLDDLNSRIKKLELNGKMPSTSSAAMSSVLGERPLTATTTRTTMSPSPKHGQVRSDSLEASTVKGPVETDMHPLLHSALYKSKDLIDPEVFRALEATASDALTLAAMTSSPSLEASTEAAESPSREVDRRLRYRANSMCRSLTELCIVLADVKRSTQLSNPKSRPQSNDATKPLAIQERRSAHASSVEPEVRTSSRVMSRLEARRTSQVALNAQVGRRESSPFGLSTPDVPAPLSAASRSSSVLLNRRMEDNQFSNHRAAALSENPQPLNRPPPHERISREYTSQHPLPSYPQRSPSVQSSLPQRKNYFLNSNSASPITPSTQPHNREILDRSTPPSNGTSRLAEARQRREASQRLSAGLDGSTRAGLLNIRAGSADIRRAP